MAWTLNPAPCTLGPPLLQVHDGLVERPWSTTARGEPLLGGVCGRLRQHSERGHVHEGGAAAPDGPQGAHRHPEQGGRRGRGEWGYHASSASACVL